MVNCADDIRGFVVELGRILQVTGYAIVQCIKILNHGALTPEQTSMTLHYTLFENQ